MHFARPRSRFNAHGATEYLAPAPGPGKLRVIMNTPDRRKQRSHDPLVALHYQLAQARSRDGLDAVVLADEAGIVVAGAGSWAVCEELAAYAPLLAEGAAPVSDRMLAFREALDVRPLAGGAVFLCTRGSAPEESLVTTAQGVERILRAA